MPYVPAAVRTGFRVLSQAAPPLAIRLGSRAFWRVGPPTPVRPADRSVHESAERGTVEVSGARLATYRWGDPGRPAVLLVHGWQSRASRLAALVAPLTGAGLRVVAFDGVAHGDSTGRYMSAIDHMAAMRALQAQDGPYAAVVGHSLGGLSAGLALHDGFAADRFVSISAMTGVDALAETFLRLTGMSPGLHDRFVDHATAAYPGAVPDLRRRVDLLAHPVPESVATTFVHDADDRMARPDGARRLRAAHPGSTLVQTRGLGHTRIVDDARVQDVVVAHVTGDRAPARP
jgi:pimeloyl-ACP methyl ester carboxylesterase